MSDAYLQVRQKRATRIVTTQGEFILEYILPGQRSGSRDWHLHLKGVLLSESGMQQFCGAPALCYIQRQLLLNTHVDDLQLVGTSVCEQVLDQLERAGLTLKVEGPVVASNAESVCHFLKRSFVATGGGVQVQQDAKYVQSSGVDHPGGR